PLSYFNQKAVHDVTVPQTPDGFNWNIFLQQDTATLNQYSAKLKDIIDISKFVDSLGNIHWQVPTGDYVIMWFGYTGTGSGVSTSGPGGGGLAIDYMDSSAMDLQFNHVPLVMINNIKESVRAGQSGLRYLHDDSWELGAANWTPGFIGKFEKRMGYNPVLYLPILTGQIIENKDISNRFLYDFRRVIADLIAKNHYGRLRTLAHKYGLGIHPESGGPHPAPIDALMNLGISDIPMGEFWAKVKTHRVQDYQRIFVKQSASAAHVYGRRYIQEEGPTSIGPQWEMDPSRLKPTIDRAFCEGMNRIVFHTFTHSPDSVGKPGYEYFAGTHFNPNITWWKQAPAYTEYITRCQLMLQQGAFVGDVCFYYGDNVPNQVHLKRINPSLGEGYDYDWVNTQMILDSMYVKNHCIYFQDGMHYEVLVLPDRKAIPLSVLKKIKRLVQNGATVIGTKPAYSTGLSDYPAADKSVKNIANELWGDVSDTTVKERDYGNGKIVWGKTIRQVLKERSICPDFIAEGKEQLQDVDYIHRRYGDYDIYFVCNWRDTAQWFTADFRVMNKLPSLWYPGNGTIIPQTVFTSYTNHISLPLYLPPHGSVFVVFKGSPKDPHIEGISCNDKTIYPFPSGATVDSLCFIAIKGNKLLVNQAGKYSLHFSDNTDKQIAVPAIPLPDSVRGPWKLYFDTAWGGPGNVTFDKLMSWTQSKMKGIKYYSGTVIYRNSFNLDADNINSNLRIILNLHTVHNLAVVRINGKVPVTLWKEPFSVDITRWVHPGINQLEIQVINLWPNRIIGDQSLPSDKRYTHTNVIKFTKDYPLLPSGLIGPIVIKFKPLIDVTKKQ
ncbi:MAG TPA: glycosyl hydrolase, partial [Chitinophagaceae bacterium]|nr:glycosyl hydrolase [Chitinophagaceae bacterium]